jgi:hypothetical protein
MFRHVRFLQSLLAATLLLCALTAAASANRLSSTSRTIRSTWRSAEFIPPIGEVVKCPVTLEGSLHSGNVAKTAGALMGYITRTIINSPGCSGGHATILTATLPWHVLYRSFQGTLPNITVLETSVIGVAFLVEGTFGLECLYVSTATEPVLGDLNRNATTHVIASSGVGGEINSTTGCGIFGEHIRARLRGTSSTTTQLGSTTAITVTLI